MRRRTRLDPLLHLMLGALGLAPAVSCGGTSVKHEGAGGSTATAPLGACENPAPVGDTGWIQCDNGVLHRASEGQCAPHVPSPADGESCGPCPGVSNAWCLHVSFQEYSCVAGCTTDADCAGGEICYCDPQGGRCIPSDCTTDADCGGASLCATYEGPPKPACGYSLSGAACQTKADRCAGDECNCVLVNDHRECVMGLGGCGRPFLVEGQARRAECEERAGWVAADVVPARLAELTADERSALAAHFSEIALMEHASVAAFARFALELCALGAPSDLVLDASLAMADETRHAELAFALASAYAGRTLGPSPLALDGALELPTLESVLRNVLLEGCIGETLAAAEAQELARSAADPVLRGVFALIARDEARHAALAYRFVGWALSRDRALVGRVVRTVLEGELTGDATRPERAIPEDDRSLALGVATPSLRRALRRDTLDQVVAPCVNALLAAGAASRAA